MLVFQLANYEADFTNIVLTTFLWYSDYIYFIMYSYLYYCPLLYLILDS